MSKRPSIKDLAEAAGVSVATVDRVLNNRQRVKQATAQQVMLAAERIGYHAAPLIKHRLRENQPKRRFHFILQKADDVFYRRLGEALSNATRRYPDIQGEPVVEFYEEIVLTAMAERIRVAAHNAIALVAVSHPRVNDAIENATRQGVPVFCLLTDVDSASRSGYLGVDNRKRGRTAAWAIANLSRKPGRVGILLGTHRYLGQEMSESSFRSYLREYTPDYSVLETLIDLDDSRLAYQSAINLINGTPDLVGIYSAGGGTERLIQALRDEGVGGQIVTVCNELIPVTRQALIDHVVDMVIATPTDRLALEMVQAMAVAVDNPERGGLCEVVLSADLFISENV